MKKYYLGLVLLALAGTDCFAASVCTVTEAAGNVSVACDGASSSLAASAQSATDPFTAELNVLLQQGYKIVSSAGGANDVGGWIETILVK